MNPQAGGNTFAGGAVAPTPILYSLISRGTSILTRQASCAGNFAEVTDQVLAKISHGNLQQPLILRCVLAGL